MFVSSSKSKLTSQHIIHHEIHNGARTPKMSIADLSPSHQSGTLKKKIVCMEKFYDIDHVETSTYIFSVYYVTTFNKAGKLFFMFCKLLVIVPIAQVSKGCDDN